MVSEGKVGPSVHPNPGPADTGRVSDAEPSTAESLRDAANEFFRAVAKTRDYLSIQADRARVLLRNLVLFAVLGTVAAIIAATVLVSATVLLCFGLARGIGELLGGRMWAGELIVGAIVLTSLFVSAWIFAKRIRTSSRERILREYEQEQMRN
jgi:hypothetical protein